MTEVKPTDTTEEEQETSFQSSSGCSICNKEFEEDNEHLGHDCHFTCIQRRHTCRMYCNYSFQCSIVSTIFRNLKQNNDGNISKANEIDLHLYTADKIEGIPWNSEELLTVPSCSALYGLQMDSVSLNIVLAPCQGALTLTWFSPSPVGKSGLSCNSRSVVLSLVIICMQFMDSFQCCCFGVQAMDSNLSCDSEGCRTGLRMSNEPKDRFYLGFWFIHPLRATSHVAPLTPFDAAPFP